MPENGAKIAPKMGLKWGKNAPEEGVEKGYFTNLERNFLGATRTPLALRGGGG